MTKARRFGIVVAALVFASGLVGIGLRRAPACGEEVATAPALEALELPNAKYPQPGVISAGQPSAEQLEQAKNAGVKVVVNLRGPHEPGVAEEKALVERLGMRYIHMPITKGALEKGLSEENARKLAAIVAKAKDEPVLIHCASGNRVGALMALMKFYVEKKTPEEAIAFGRKAGLSGLERYVRRILEKQAGGGK